MKPILFAKNATVYTTNGIGRLDCVECKVTEERNGQYELEMIVPESGLHASEIEMSSIIVVKPFQGGSNQPFRVYKITKPFNGLFAVYAQHISYQLSYIPVMPFSVQASVNAANETLQKMTSPVYCAETNPFTFWTNVDTVASFEVGAPASIRSCLGGVEGSVLDKFGGEYEWDGYTVKLWKNRGVTVPTVTLKYGQNLTDLSQEEYISNTITGVCPFWRDAEGENIVTLTEKVVESEYADNYPFRRTVPLDLSQDFDQQPTEAQLRTNATAYLNASGIGIPTVSIKVSFVNLADTEEYKNILPLQTVKLCDMVNVKFEKLGISTTAKVVKTVYDVLNERYDSVEIGTIRTSLASTITDATSALTTAQSQLSSKFKQFGNTVEADIINATAWLTGSSGYVHAVKNTDGTWKELIFADTNDPDTWHNLLRINENGMGFSSDGGQTYKQAWTLDGKLVIGGTNVPSLTVYDSNGDLVFRAGRVLDGQGVLVSDGVEWDVQYSSMTPTGELTATNATLNNATINGGSLTQVSADGQRQRYIQLANGNIHGGFGQPGDSDNVMYMAYRLTDQGINYDTINLKGDALIFQNDEIYVAPSESDGHGGNPAPYKGLTNDNYKEYSTDNIDIVEGGDLTSLAVVTGYEPDGVTLHTETITVVTNNRSTHYYDVISGSTTRSVLHGLVLEGNLNP